MLQNPGYQMQLYENKLRKNYFKMQLYLIKM